jgi:hypothetical protein
MLLGLGFCNPEHGAWILPAATGGEIIYIVRVLLTGHPRPAAARPCKHIQWYSATIAEQGVNTRHAFTRTTCNPTSCSGVWLFTSLSSTSLQIKQTNHYRIARLVNITSSYPGWPIKNVQRMAQAVVQQYCSITGPAPASCPLPSCVAALC